ncbi:auxin-responsive protein SAUR72-like [Musa acuminata AAA Group]|uniref:auxin-responsive protein SAUR72-like n=1 Tax=Musa acuminata AAA Group TaxID=214697 RepID=UPI0031D8D7AB
MGSRMSKLRRLLRHGHGKEEPVSASRGYVPVIVGLGDDSKRFVIHLTMLGDAKMLELLYVSAEEFGFRNPGILRIPCDAGSFERWMHGKNSRQIHKFSGEEVISFL